LSGFPSAPGTSRRRRRACSATLAASDPPPGDCQLLARVGGDVDLRGGAAGQQSRDGMERSFAASSSPSGRLTFSSAGPPPCRCAAAKGRRGAEHRLLSHRAICRGHRRRAPPQPRVSMAAVHGASCAAFAVGGRFPVSMSSSPDKRPTSPAAPGRQLSRSRTGGGPDGGAARVFVYGVGYVGLRFALAMRASPPLASPRRSALPSAARHC
jgi:hypothetical protein